MELLEKTHEDLMEKDPIEDMDSEEQDTEDEETDVDPNEDLDDDEEANIDEVPTGKGDYTADEFREIIDYIYDVLDKEDDDELNDSVGEIGLELLYNYADVLPQTVINQVVDDLKEMFEIEDTLLESIVCEGAKFVKKIKGSIAKAAAKKSRIYYKKNKSKLKLRGQKWRKSSHGKKMITLHKKVQDRLGAKKGMRLVTAPSAV